MLKISHKRVLPGIGLAMPPASTRSSGPTAALLAQLARDRSAIADSVEQIFFTIRRRGVIVQRHFP
jgi:hypothetical protein